jgi:hypothetical protein
LSTRLDLILFVITSTGLAILIPPDGRGHLFLGGCRLRQEQQPSLI